jgi:hypothetical protein
VAGAICWCASPIASKSASRAAANNFASIIYIHPADKQDRIAAGETFMPPASQPQQKNKKVMGDKSPKANQKKSGQKETKTSSANAKKSAAVAAKSAAGKKK